jgi:hypothetical protein
LNDPRQFSPATFTATSCEEDRLPWVRTAAPADRLAQARQAVLGLPTSAFGPFGPRAALATPLLDLCLEWPAAPSYPAPGATQVPAAPALLIGGDGDARTPVEDAHRVATSLPHAQLLIARGAGHSVLVNDQEGCFIRAFRRFLNGAPTGSCPSSPLLVGVRRFPLSLREVTPVRGVGGRVGSTLASLILTIQDATPDFTSTLGSIFTGAVLRKAGLRGGSAALSEGGEKLVLHGVSFIPGVRVSGSLTHFASERGVRGRLQIGGRAAARGTLTVQGGTVVGRLAGHPVRTRLKLNLFALTFRARAASSAQAADLPGAAPIGLR